MLNLLVVLSYIFLLKILLYNGEQYIIPNEEILSINGNGYTSFATLNETYITEYFYFVNSDIHNPSEMIKLKQIATLNTIVMSSNHLCCDFDFAYLHPSLSILDLSTNQISSIKNSLQQFISVYYIDLSYNDIRYISSIVFNNTALEIVILSFNSIMRIDSFSKIRTIVPTIHMILIDNNLFTCNEMIFNQDYSIKESPIIQLLPDSHYVNICSNSDKNIMTINKETNALCCSNPITESTFYVPNEYKINSVKKNFTKLDFPKSEYITKSFILKNSYLNATELKNLNILKYVETIRLDSNNICCDFDFQYIKKCKQLTWLTLENNKLSKIKNSLGILMPKLKDISFNFNNIATLSMNIFLTFPNLKYIGLSYTMDD